MAVSPGTSAAYGVGPPYTASFTATYMATDTSDSSTPATASVRRLVRQIARVANAATTSPAGTNFVPSHGSDPSSRKQAAVARRETCSSSFTASSAAPASAVPAVSSG